MAGNKFDRKMRFLPLLPFGYSSKLATSIEGKGNPYAGLYLLGSNPDEVIAKCEQFRQRTLYRARDLCEKGYVKDVDRACGTPSMTREFRAMTTSGLAVLAEFPSYTFNDKKVSVDHFFSRTYSSDDLRDTLFGFSDSPYTSDQEQFHEILLDSVMNGRLTPLSAAIDLAGNVKINLDKYSPNQRYNIWRQSHIQAMFLANGHLTYLDRRPYETGFAIDGISDESSYNAYQLIHGTTLAAYTYHALTTWYRHHPDYYQITQQYPTTGEEAHQAWLTTPAYYSSLELPYTKRETAIQINSNAKGSRQVVNAVHVGLAAGRNVNYACYHAYPGEFRWLPKREKKTKEILESAVVQMKRQNPDIPYKDKVDFALIFCTSHHQFKSLFAQTQKKHILHKKLKPATDAPYAGVHVIPVNDSGTILLWHLLEQGPLAAEFEIHKQLIEMNTGFRYHTSRTYPLIYKNKLVFSGYTMNLYKIHRALEDHLDGVDFYVCCFPDQVAWYRKLFPGKTFL